MQELVCAQAALILGYGTSGAVEASRTFRELGCDSPALVELRKRLSAITGLRLVTALFFAHPTPVALAGHLLGELTGLGTVYSPLSELRRSAPAEEPIAIVGMSCRFPGGVGSPRELWELVSSGVDAIGGFPADRGWDLEALYDPDPARVGCSYVREGGFLYDAGEFDADFFGIGPREALAMDPQQRLLLEGAWEAFEDAGVAPESVRGSQTGVFIGAMTQDYGPRLCDARDGAEGYTLTGNSTSVASGRVAYLFGLQGPALTVDTACSSSLVALHTACRSLRQGECGLALAGGVAVMADPGMFVEFSRQRGLSIDGRCRSFGADAGGVGWSEGMGLLLLERLSDARANNRQVLAIVRGSAVNQDGASNGLTAPSGPSQESVIRGALADAGLSPAEIDVVEAHGTGTALGDPVEAQALLSTYGRQREGGGALWLGSLKSNIGHTQAASGVGGVIKMVMAMRRGVLPATLHAEVPSPQVDWTAGQVRLLSEQTRWARRGAPRRAGISSFGISGTNAHVILEESPAAEPSPPMKAHGSDRDGSSTSPSTAGVLPFLVSAASDRALSEQAARLSSRLRAVPEVELGDVAGALALGRAQLSHRAVVLADGPHTLIAGLRALEHGEPLNGLLRGVAQSGSGGRVALLFSGQGSQWAGMGRELHARFTIFADALAEVCAAFDAELARPLTELLFAAEDSPEAALLDRTEFTQPAMFALEVALYRLVTAFGVTPDFLLGHSIGEISAACVAGVFSVEDACAVVAARGRLMGALPDGGAMAAVSVSEQEALQSLCGFEGRLTLAAVNAPEGVVVSGDAAAVGAWETAFAADGRKVKRLRVSHAFHSHLMDPMLAEFKTLIEGVSLREPTLPIVSNVSGQTLSAAEATSPEYWANHVRGTVRFCDGVQFLQRAGVTCWLELGPGSALCAMAHQSLDQSIHKELDSGERTVDNNLIASSVRAHRPETRELITLLAQAHVHGLSVDWGVLFAGRETCCVDLPTYAFQRRRFWLEHSGEMVDASAVGQAAADHPLLGAVVELPEGGGWLFTGRVSLGSHPWLADHAVFGTVLLPGTAFLELALHAARWVGLDTVEELVLEVPLIFGERNAVALRVAVGGADDRGAREVTISSRRPGADVDTEWTRHASGILAGAAAEVAEPSAGSWPPDGRRLVGAWPPEGARPLDVGGVSGEGLDFGDVVYGRLAELGFEYGPEFRGLAGVWRRGEEVFAQVALGGGQAGEAGRFGVHPALLDAALHAGLLASVQAGEEVGLPFVWGGVVLHACGAGELRVRITRGARGFSLVAFDGGGALVVEVGSLGVRAVDPGRLGLAGGGDSLFGVDWVGVPVAGGDDSVTEGVAVGGVVAGGVAPGGVVPGGVAVLGAGVLPGAGHYPDLAGLLDSLGEQGAVPGVVVVEFGGGGGGDLPSGAHVVLKRPLLLLQRWLGEPRLAGARLVLITRGAVCAVEGDEPDLGLAALWGLVRSARSEHPGRFALVDLDRDEASLGVLPAVLAYDEPELAIREGAVLTPRLTPVAQPAVVSQPAAAGTGNGKRRGFGWDPQRTVLLTGGTGGLGSLFARHLAQAHGARRLLLVSRRGPDAPGAAELQSELEQLGAQVTIAACDVAEREQLRVLLDAVPPEHPLGAVIHAAGVLDDGVIEGLTPERLDRVLAPKLDAAWYLHELSEGHDLDAFILFSSIASTIGVPGQANYAAANAFLDALAQHRHTQHLPATTLAWGLWKRDGGMASRLDAAGLARIGRSGVGALSDEEGLDLFDAAVATGGAFTLPVRFDGAGLSSQAAAGTLAPVLRGLTRVRPSRRRAAAGKISARLAGVPENDRGEFVLDLVCAEVAVVLGHGSAVDVDPRKTLKALGFDSLAAVELRNRLNTATGLRLPSALVFDYPTPTGLAEHLLAEATASGSAPQAVAKAQAGDEHIAIIGMACRFPGGVHSPEELWRLIAAGGDAISEFPVDRGWDLERLYDPDPDRAGCSYTRHGGFLHDAGDFDAEFFGINPREALAMDPQQRLLLEGAWEALENAGVDAQSVRGTQAGVFAGIMHHDYGPAGNSDSLPDGVEGYLATGIAGSVASGRVAHEFGLEGPALTVDTACSSSLVALHLACQALRGGECSLALAGGSTVLSTPRVFTEFSRQRGLSVDGRCKPFAEAADGVGWAEGVGVLVLERLSDAERAGHSILAVVGGSAVNQDGASNGLTAPNGPSQERVIRQALANAGLESRDVDVVEAHGTGTTLGDPIEAGALLATYGRGREDRPLLLGSIKSNIGHTQAAAGVAGVIKIVEAMRHSVLPRTLHVDRPSSHVEWEAGGVRLLTEDAPWERGRRPRRAGVSSFGISGTNAHVILEEAPAATLVAVAPDGEPAGREEAQTGIPAAALAGSFALPLSAKTRPALQAAAGRLARRMEDDPDLALADVGFSLATTRALLDHRAVVFGDDRPRLLAGLAALRDGRPGIGTVEGDARGGKLAYLFTGQGAQRPGMGAELYAASPPFAAAFDAVCEQLDGHLAEPLKGIVFGTHPHAVELLDRTEFTQPALFALEVALFGLLERMGIRPGYLVGHSIGELAAAHVAGVFSLPDACKLVAARGRLMGELPANGAMVAVQASEAEVTESIAGRETELSIAAVNAPGAVVLSGERAAVEALAEQWMRRGRKTKRLAVSHAFHSALMDPMLADFEAVARGLTYGEPRIPILSTLTGEILGAELARDPAYWARHARGAVRFADAVTALAERGTASFIELGPDGVLCAMAAASLPEELDATLAPLLRGGSADREALVGALAAVHVVGRGVEWAGLYRGGRCVGLPTYAFQRERFWLDPSVVSGGASVVGLRDAGHPLLGAVVELAGGEGWLFTGRVSLQGCPWLCDHVVFGVVLMAGTALLELALYAAGYVGLDGVEELMLRAPLVLPERGGVVLQVRVGVLDERGGRPVVISSCAEVEGGEWVCHATGVLGAVGARSGSSVDVSVWPPLGAKPLDVADVYRELAGRGYGYGPAFQCLAGAWRDGQEVFAEVALAAREREAAGGFVLHPALLDASFHAALSGTSDTGTSDMDTGTSDTDISDTDTGTPDHAALSGTSDTAPAPEPDTDPDTDPDTTPLPFAWRGVRIHQAGARSARVHVTLAHNSFGLVAHDEAGSPIVTVDSVALRPAARGELTAQRRDTLFGLRWNELELAGEPSAIAIERHESIEALRAALGGDTSGATPPEWVLVEVGRQQAEDSAAGAHAATASTLSLLQDWLANERFAETGLVLLTRGAVAAVEGDRLDLTQAPLWGLLRSARSEHPGRFVAIDLDDAEDSLAALPAAVAAGEPQLALRGGTALVPRLVAVAGASEERERLAFDPERTVLITGGTGGIGGLLARHLVEVHGVRRLLLASRRGGRAERASECQRELEALGAVVTIAACDVAEREQVRALLDAIPPEHSLGAVIHAAGVLEDGLIESLDHERLRRVMAPKVDAAWHLHELTAGLDLSAFVLFSSAAGLLGGSGQGNYAAANAFLDALAHHRVVHGLTGQSLAWGLWEQASGMAEGMSDAELVRFRHRIRTRLGFLPMSSQRGLELFDAALGLREPIVVAVEFASEALHGQAEQGGLPPLLSGVVHVPARRAGGDSPAAKLAALPEVAREEAVLELVLSEVAVVLSYGSATKVEPERALKEIGFDSLTAVELRNRLNAATGMRLPVTLVFDHPTPAAIAELIRTKIAGNGAARSTIDEQLEKLEAMLAAVPPDGRLRNQADARLRLFNTRVQSQWAGVSGDAWPGGEPVSAEGLEEASDEELFEIIEQEFGAA